MSLLKAQRNDNKIVQSKDDLQIGNLSMDQFGYLKVQNIDEIKNDITTINTNINDISIDVDKIASSIVNNSLNVNITNNSIPVVCQDIIEIKNKTDNVGIVNELKQLNIYMKKVHDILVSLYQTSNNRLRVHDGTSL